jgi:pimeloyl-ACP methyl ester carboxylesterase
MIHRARLLAFAFGLAVTLLAPSASASADPGPCTTREGSPSCTILRPIGAPQRVPPPDAPECIVGVGGLGSGNDDGTFTELFLPFAHDPRYRIHRFGGSEDAPDRYPYDTSGSLDANARRLRDLVRDLGTRCHAIHIVAHSMGGAVADRAFSLGLSSADGVATYLPISAPHNGAVLARILTDANDISDEGNAALRLISERLRAAGLPAQDITSPAVRDLAEPVLPRPPRGVVELRQRLANDEIVLLPDGADRRYDSRDRMPVLNGLESVAVDILAGNVSAIVGDTAKVTTTVLGQGLRAVQEVEGHGGSLVNTAIRATTEFVIRNVALPPDDRDLKEKVLAFALSVGVLILMYRLAGGLSNVLVKGVLLGTAVTVPLRAALPGWDAWWTKSFPNLVHKAAAMALPEEQSLEIEKAIVTRLRNEVDRLEGDDEMDPGGRARGSSPDPRIALVRAVLDRAAQVLARL